jgi:hypothetical protein
MQLFREAVKRKLGIIRFNSRTFGVQTYSASVIGAPAPSICRPSFVEAAQFEAGRRGGASSVSFTGFGV